jgi:hypothetical protein
MAGFLNNSVNVYVSMVVKDSTKISARLKSIPGPVPAGFQKTPAVYAAFYGKPSGRKTGRPH